MKLGVVGKGGVGKTTLSALLAQAYAADGKVVLAVDTDSNPNLAMSLGLDLPAAEALPLLPRSLAVGGGDGSMSPAAMIATYGTATPSGVTLVNAMRITQPGGG